MWEKESEKFFKWKIWEIFMKLKSMKCLFSWASRIKPKITVSVLFLFLVLKLQFSPIMTPVSLIYHAILFRYHLSCYFFPNETFSLQLQLFVSPYSHNSFSFVSFWSVQPFSQSHLPLWLPFVSLLGAALWLILIAFAHLHLLFLWLCSPFQISRLTLVFPVQPSSLTGNSLTIVFFWTTQVQISHCWMLLNVTFRMNHKHDSLC